MHANDLLTSVFGNLTLGASGRNLHSFTPAIFEKTLAPWLPFINEFDTDRVIEACQKEATVAANPILLFSVDLSGIQDTVYTISSKGALKSLRARSFMLELLCEHICYELVTNFIGPYEKHREHVMFSGGGGCVIVLPNKSQLIDDLESFIEKLNEWAFEEFYGKLFVAHAALMLAADDFSEERFKKVWDRLGTVMKEKKQKKFFYKLSLLFSEEYLNASEPKQHTNHVECQICHRDNIDLEKTPFYLLDSQNAPIRNFDQSPDGDDQEDKIFAHELCYNLYHLGDSLADVTNRAVVREKDKPDDHSWISFPRFDVAAHAFYRIADKSGQVEHRWEVNAPDSSPFLYAYYARMVGDLSDPAKAREKEIAKKETINPRNTASMAGLAAAACDADFVCALRMDVDNMGQIFSTGLIPFTADNYARMSRLMNWFFKVFLVKLCSVEPIANQIDITTVTGAAYHKKGRDVSIIYAGGDDLFIVGAWNQVIELAYDIHDAFEKFSGLGISGGCTLHQDNYPLYQMARMSGLAEEVSKKFIDWPAKKRTEPPRKNRITLFYSPFYEQKNNELNEKANAADPNNAMDFDKVLFALPWCERTHIEIVKALVSGHYDPAKNKVDLKYISRGFLNKLFNIAEVWWRDSVMYLPEFMWLIHSNKNLKNEPSIAKLQKIIVEGPIKHYAVRLLRIPVIWLDLLQRVGGKK